MAKVSAVPIQIKCSQCEGDDVTRDAWAVWDVETQDWVLGAVFDYAYCQTCEAEARLIDVELQIGSPNVQADYRDRPLHP